MGGKGSGGHNRIGASRHLLNGTYRPDRHHAKPPVNKRGNMNRDRARTDDDRKAVETPTWLKGKARTAWASLAPELNEIGLLTRLDRQALELLCMTYSRWRAAEEDMRKNGITYETTTASGSVMRRKNPAVDISAEAELRLSSLMERFGLFPTDRIDGHDPAPLEERDEYEDEFFRVPRSMR